MKNERFKASVFALAVVVTPALLALAGTRDLPDTPARPNGDCAATMQLGMDDGF
jgi:hypothetical protein